MSQDHASGRTAASERLDEAMRATWTSAAVNLLMTVAQIAVGWIAHSQSLVAHGLHSLSDLLSDFLVLFASREGASPADAGHPYGHARIETAATLILGVSLIGVGGGILWESSMRLQHLDRMEVIQWSAFWVAVATVVAKEGLYRYLIRVAERLRSQLLTANALHTRADAASALVVVIGIGGALMGWRFLDLLAAALMGFMILRMGVELAWSALRELVDTGLDSEQVGAISETVMRTPGVIGLHELRTRRMAHQALVDAHVQVDGRISVSEGHRIAEEVRRRVLKEHAEVLDVLVHIDPEQDVDPSANQITMPDRETLLVHLQPLLAGLPEPRKVTLHYLGGRVEAEVFFDHRFFENGEALKDAEEALNRQLHGHPYFRSVSLNCLVAPP